MIDTAEVKRFIDTNLRATLGLKEISVALNKHPADLDRTFRSIERITIKKYIDRELKREVAFLIQRNGLRGYSIGEKLGFWSDQSFYRWTKRVFGIRYSLLHSQMGSLSPELSQHCTSTCPRSMAEAEDLAEEEQLLG